MASHDDLSALRAQHDAATSAAPLPWSLVLRTVDTGDGDGDRDVLDANGEVVTWIDGRSAVAELIVGAVNMLRELMDAADERDRLRAEVDRRVAAGTKATVDAVSVLSRRCGELAAELLDARRSGFDEQGKTRAAPRDMEAKRDRARATAVALEQQNAVLLETADEVTRARADQARATGPDPWADAAELRAAIERAIGRETSTEAEDDVIRKAGLWPHLMPSWEVVLRAVLARTDPLRDADGGEDRG